MSRVCHVCGKRTMSGGRITRRGLAKKKGGIGMHVVKVVKRVFRPNLQSVHILENGVRRRVKVCANCIRGERIVKG